MWPDPIKDLFTRMAGNREMSLQDSLQGTHPGQGKFFGEPNIARSNARKSMTNVTGPEGPLNRVAAIPIDYAWGGGTSYRPSFDPATTSPEAQREMQVQSMGANTYAKNRYSPEVHPIMTQFFNVFDLLAKTGKQKPETMESVLGQLGELEAQIPGTGQMFMRMLDSDTFKGHPFHIYLRSRPTDQSAPRKK